MKVQQFYNKNQFLITDDNFNYYLQSYQSIVAKIDKNGVLYFGDDWDYSNTTRKHLYLFLNDYKCNISGNQYLEIFYKKGGLFMAKNKSAFLRRLISHKIIKVRAL